VSMLRSTTFDNSQIAGYFRTTARSVASRGQCSPGPLSTPYTPTECKASHADGGQSQQPPNRSIKPNFLDALSGFSLIPNWLILSAGPWTTSGEHGLGVSTLRSGLHNSNYRLASPMSTSTFPYHICESSSVGREAEDDVRRYWEEDEDHKDDGDTDPDEVLEEIYRSIS
jgi:hypothetical protein